MRELEEHIIQDAAGGNIEAFEVIYKETRMYVYAVALRTVLNRELAEEVAQDVFVRLYTHLKTFDFRSSLKTWLYRITINTAINAIKKQAKERARQEKYSTELLTEPSPSIRHEHLTKEEHEQLIEKILSYLNPDQRACVILREIEGLSYQEIAETLEIKINTVRSRLKRARELLVEKVAQGAIKK